MLLTRSPLIHQASLASPFDLHVLSTPPAFILSQDQTLRKKDAYNHRENGSRSEFETDQRETSLLTYPYANPRKGWSLIQRNFSQSNKSQTDEE